MTYDLKLRIWRGDSSGGDLSTTPSRSTRARWSWTRFTTSKRAGRRPGGAVELQGRQVRVVLSRDQRRPRLMCLARLSTFPQDEPITITPMRAFPVIRDLVTDVASTTSRPPRCRPSRQAPSSRQAPFRMQQVDVERSQEFRKCIECFLCQNTCHVDPRPRGEQGGLRRAPLLHPVRRARHASQRRPRPQEARPGRAGLGMCNITKCCTEVCPENIKITDNGIIPMKERVVDVKYDPVRFLGRRRPKTDRSSHARPHADGAGPPVGGRRMPQPLRAARRAATSLGVTRDLWCSLECTPACQAGGRGFKSRQVRGRIAQLVERAAEKREVAGSTPAPTTPKPPWSEAVFCFPGPGRGDHIRALVSRTLGPLVSTGLTGEYWCCGR